MRQPAASVDEYLSKLTPAQRAMYEKVRGMVRAQEPKIEEVMSYGMPTFKLGKKPVLYFGAFKDHLSLFPASDGMIGAVSALAKFRTGKGTLQFTEAQPIPDELIKQIIQYRLRV